MDIRTKKTLDNYENNMSDIFDDFNSISNYDNDYGFQDSLLRSQNRDNQNINNNNYNNLSIDDSFVDRRSKINSNFDNNKEPDYANFQDNNYEDYFDNDYFNPQSDNNFTNMSGNQSNFEDISNYNYASKSKKPSILSYIKCFFTNEKNVARYIVMVLIVVAICSLIGGIFAYLSSKKSNNNDDYSQYKNTFVDSDTSSESDDNVKKATVDMDNSLESDTLVIDKGNETQEDKNVDNKSQSSTADTNVNTKTTKTDDSVKQKNADTSLSDNTISASTKPASEPSDNEAEPSDINETDVPDKGNASISHENDNTSQSNKPEIVCTFSPGGNWKSGEYYCCQYEVYITNNTQATIENWKGILSLSNGASVSSMWNATYKSDSAKGTVIVTPEGWNSKIDVNKQISFGIIVQTKSPETFSISLSVE